MQTNSCHRFLTKSQPVFPATTTLLTIPAHMDIALYLIGTIAMGVILGMRMKTCQDLFPAGRQLPWWAIGMSPVATDIGGTDIIGIGGAACSRGLAGATFEWIGCVPAMIVGAFVFIPFFCRTGVCTIPEFPERRCNVAVRSVLVPCAVGFAFARTFLKEGSGICAIFQTLMAFVQGPLFAILLIGILTPRAGSERWDENPKSRAAIALIIHIVINALLRC